MIVRIDDKNIPGGVDGEAVWFVELAIPGPMTTELEEEIAVEIIFFDAVVERVAHIEYLIDAAEGDPFGIGEFSIAGAAAPP